MEKIKCPHCKKKIEITYRESIVAGPIFRNLILSLFVCMLLFQYLPFDIEHGYSLNWDLVLALIVSILFAIGTWLYKRKKNKEEK